MRLPAVLYILVSFWLIGFGTYILFLQTEITTELIRLGGLVFEIFGTGFFVVAVLLDKPR